MRTSFCCLTGIAIPCFVITLLPLASAQIVGCDTLDCGEESSSSDDGSCTFFDEGVGAISFPSNVSTSGPLTWTVAGWSDDEVDSGSPRGTRRLTKEFYFGTPPEVKLENADFHGCGLLFLNITPALQLVAGFDDFSTFGCGTVLGDQCVQDLLEQTRGVLENNLAVTPEGSTVCDAVRQSIEAAPLPSSCNLPFGRTSWGAIGLGDSIAGANSFITYKDQDKCDITGQGADYRTTNPIGMPRDLNPDSEDGRLWLDGTTPVITMFFNEKGVTNTGLAEPEVHLSCLRTLPSRAEETSGGVRTRSVSITWMAMMVMGVLVLA